MLITMIIIGQLCLSVPILLVRAKKAAIYLPLALFLLAIGILAQGSMVSSLFPAWYAFYTALAFPTLFLLCPSLWFYVEGLTSSTPWTLNKKQLHHYFLIWPALLVSVMILLLPKDMHTAIFIEDVEVVTPLAITLYVSILVVILLWLGQCTYTIFRIVQRLIAYRRELKSLFSNNEGRELNWMNWLLLVAISTWLFFLAMVFSSNLFDNFLFNIRTEALLSLLLIWSLAHFGLQQKPGITGYSDHAPINIPTQNDDAHINKENEKILSTSKKYLRSALSKEQSHRIAEKINAVMHEDKLYLDANLSLQKLANHLVISPNYISQTLNETLAINFFDFVNQWRIKDAKPKILANKNTVLDIALEVGFNARSSFYKAFKQEVGKTPSEFRKHYMQH
ncbi:MAG: AraC-like DNA-binding protein [Alteromonadaceae bacterium]|jgi:AraC-like DNA-binding protein